MDKTSLALSNRKMTYSRTKKLSDTEKKLQSIRAQLYGKEDIQLKARPSDLPTYSLNTRPDIKTSTAKTTLNSSYNYAVVTPLKQDLIKIFVLAAFAIGIQLLLYLGQQQGLLPKTW